MIKTKTSVLTRGWEVSGLVTWIFARLSFKTVSIKFIWVVKFNDAQGATDVERFTWLEPAQQVPNSILTGWIP